MQRRKAVQLTLAVLAGMLTVVAIRYHRSPRGDGSVQDEGPVRPVRAQDRGAMENPAEGGDASDAKATMPVTDQPLTRAVPSPGPRSSEPDAAQQRRAHGSAGAPLAPVTGSTLADSIGSSTESEPAAVLSGRHHAAERFWVGGLPPDSDSAELLSFKLGRLLSLMGMSRDLWSRPLENSRLDALALRIARKLSVDLDPHRAAPQEDRGSGDDGYRGFVSRVSDPVSEQIERLHGRRCRALFEMPVRLRSLVILHSQDRSIDPELLRGLGTQCVHAGLPPGTWEPTMAALSSNPDARLAAQLAELLEMETEAQLTNIDDLRIDPRSPER